MKAWSASDTIEAEQHPPLSFRPEDTNVSVVEESRCTFRSLVASLARDDNRGIEAEQRKLPDSKKLEVRKKSASSVQSAVNILLSTDNG
jgi:hypothetical protein